MAFMKKNPEAQKEVQTEVKSQEDWEKLMQKQGLVVVDAYSAWCGPCLAIVNTFKKIKNENGDDLLNFAIAETDNIESLKDYRGKSQPTFLFYGDGELVNVIRGCHGPLLTKSVVSLLKKEHQILEGTAERVIFVDEEIHKKEEKIEENKDDEIDEEEEELARKMSKRQKSKSRVKLSAGSSESQQVKVDVNKEVTVAIIKPDAVKAGLAESIIQEITAAGMEILHKEERVLSREEAAEFYKQHEGSDHFEQLIEFMSSGPCMTLVISKSGEEVGDGLIPEFRSLTGPKDVNVAKEEAPESLRAKYGTDTIQNALHSCDTNESAARELAFFFPDFNIPTVTVKQKKKRLQRTLALIRPNALAKRRDSILKAIEDAGFLIAVQKEVQLTREQAEEFYEQHKEEDYFESLITNMTCGPSLALCLAREDAVQVWRDLLGPKDVNAVSDESPEEEAEQPGSQTSLRVRFSDPEDDINPLHGADNEEQVTRELNILFPMENTVAVIKPDAFEKDDEREAIIKRIKDAGFKISAQKEVNLTKDLAAWFYKEHEGKEFYDSLTDYMSSGPTQFLILAREDAMGGFRALLGPNAPEEAREMYPESLRAQFAKDTMKNAVHGSSNPEKMKAVISEFFPDVELDEKGLVIEPSTSRDKNVADSNGNVQTETEKNDEKSSDEIAMKEGSNEDPKTEESKVEPKEGESKEEPKTEESKEEPKTEVFKEEANKEGESNKEEEAVVVAENKDVAVSSGTEATKESETSNETEPSKEREVKNADEASKEAEVKNQAVVTNECETKESVNSTEDNSRENADKLDSSVEKVEEGDGEPSQNTSDTEVKKYIETEKKEDPNVEISSESSTGAVETSESESSREPTTDSTNESPPSVNQSSAEAETSREPTNVDTDNTATSESTTGAV